MQAEAADLPGYAGIVRCFAGQKVLGAPELVLVAVDQSEPTRLDDVIRHAHRAPIVVVIS